MYHQDFVTCIHPKWPWKPLWDFSKGNGHCHFLHLSPHQAFLSHFSTLTQANISGIWGLENVFNLSYRCQNSLKFIQLLHLFKRQFSSIFPILYLHMDVSWFTWRIPKLYLPIKMNWILMTLFPTLTFLDFENLNLQYIPAYESTIKVGFYLFQTIFMPKIGFCLVLSKAS